MFCCSSSKAVVSEEKKPLTADELKQQEEQDAKVVSPFARSVAACCCLAVIDRDDVSELVTRDTSLPPSLYQRLCMCQCSPRPRPPSGIEMVPELRGLSGVTLQKGDHTTSGSLQTLKWGHFDADRRVLEMAVFGGFYSPTANIWTEPVNLQWCCLSNLGRTANYTYRFEFSEDFRNADIKIKGNPCVFCGLCCTCIPAWCTVPSCLVNFSMRQSADSTDGTAWDRYSAPLGKEPVFTYRLLEVIDANGQPGRFYDQLPLSAPKQQMVTA